MGHFFWAGAKTGRYPQKTGSARSPLRPDVRPTLALALYDVRDARLHVGDAAVHVAPRDLLVLHRVLAGEQGDAVVERVGEARGDRRLGIQHREAVAVGDDLDLHVVLAEVGLHVLRVVEREVPFRRIVVAHLEYHAVFAGGLLRMG